MYDLAGKRVAVIGTGASAVQLIPEIAGEVGELLVFQRTPPWIAPTPEYHQDLPDALRWLMGVIPDYAHWDRLWQFWRMHEGLLPAAAVDPEWPDQQRSMSMLNEFVRQMLTAHIESEYADPALAANVIEPLKMQGVEQFGDYAIQIRMKMMTKPGEQFVIRRKGYAMIKKAFAENGIQFATPTVQVAGGDSAAAAARQGLEMTQPVPTPT